MEGIFIAALGASRRRSEAVVLFALFTVLFLAVTADVALQGPYSWLNVYLFQLVIAHRAPYLNPLMIAFAKYGREFFWIPLFAAMWLLGRGNVKLAAYVMFVSFVISIPVGIILKDLLHVLRPFYYLTNYRILIAKPDDYSYPSGHALITWAGASSTYFYIRRRYAAALSLEAALVSYARVYVGVHWPLDVIGGALLGVAISMLSVYLCESSLGKAVFERVRTLSIRK